MVNRLLNHRFASSSGSYGIWTWLQFSSGHQRAWMESNQTPAVFDRFVSVSESWGSTSAMASVSFSWMYANVNLAWGHISASWLTRSRWECLHWVLQQRTVIWWLSWEIVHTPTRLQFAWRASSFRSATPYLGVALADFDNLITRIPCCCWAKIQATNGSGSPSFDKSWLWIWWAVSVWAQLRWWSPNVTPLAATKKSEQPIQHFESGPMLVKTISLILMVPTQHNKKKLTSDSCACKIISKSAT